jgi:hypothetical protein
MKEDIPDDSYTGNYFTMKDVERIETQFQALGI